MIDIKPGDIVRCVKTCPDDAADEPWAFPPGEGSVWTVTYAGEAVAKPSGLSLAGVVLKGDTLRWPGCRPLACFRKLCDDPNTAKLEDEAPVDLVSA